MNDAFMVECLEVHDELLKVQRSMHDMLSALMGFEVENDAPDNPWAS